MESKIQNYRLDSMHLSTAERLGNYGHLPFTPIGYCNSIESITSIIPMVFWRVRKMQDMSNQSIILQYIRMNITNNI